MIQYSQNHVPNKKQGKRRNKHGHYLQTIVYLENPKDPTETLLEQIPGLNEVVGMLYTMVERSARSGLLALPPSNHVISDELFNLSKAQLFKL